MLVELNTFKFVIETQNGIIKPFVFVVRTRVCSLKSPNSNFHHDDGKSSLHFFSLNAPSKQQKSTIIFIFALTFLLKMACKKVDKNDFSFFFSSFNLYFLLSTLSVSCPMFLLFYYNLQFIFFILVSKSDKLKVIIIVYCKSLCHLNPMLFHYQSFFIALSDLPILPFLFLNFLAWVLLLLQTFMGVE